MKVREQIPYAWEKVAELFSANLRKKAPPLYLMAPTGQATPNQGTRNIFPEYGSFTFWPEV
jgi:hypothetical protein